MSADGDDKNHNSPVGNDTLAQSQRRYAKKAIKFTFIFYLPGFFLSHVYRS